MAEITLGNLYDFNKQAMNNEHPLDPIEFNIKTNNLISDIYNRKSKFWMLLNNERKDYTVFIVLTEAGTLDEFRETLQNRGEILSIDKQEDNNYEIWIRDIITKENFVYYFFDYSFGIIKA